MQRLGVGIHENIVIEKAEKNDKGTLEISLKQAGDIDPIQLLTSVGNGNGSFDPAAERITIWPLTAYEQDTYQKVSDKIMWLKNQLEQILLRYTTKDKLQPSDWAKGTGISTNADLKAKVIDYLPTIYDNIVTQFIAQVRPFTGEGATPSRIKLVRQSTAKPYPTLPRFGAFIESMDVPTKASKLRFTEKEISQGLHTGDRVQAPAANQEEAVAADKLFA